MTYRLTQGVVKRIIPAVASTNAVIAAACASEVFKLATSACTPMNNYCVFNDIDGIYTYTYEHEKKVCDSGLSLSGRIILCLEYFIICGITCVYMLPLNKKRNIFTHIHTQVHALVLIYFTYQPLILYHQEECLACSQVPQNLEVRLTDKLKDIITMLTESFKFQVLFDVCGCPSCVK